MRDTQIEIVAHRGLHITEPENSISAVQAAADTGLTAVEVDVRQTRRGDLVIKHGRYMPWSSLDSFQDLLARFPSELRLYLEIKNARADVGRITRMLDEYGLQDRTTIISFHPRVLRTLDASSYPRMLITPVSYGFSIRYARALFDPIPLARSLGIQGIKPRHGLVTEAFMARAHRAGLRVIPWVVNDIAQARRLQEFAVDGLITDRPLDIRRALYDSETIR